MSVRDCSEFDSLLATAGPNGCLLVAMHEARLLHVIRGNRDFFPRSDDLMTQI